MCFCCWVPRNMVLVYGLGQPGVFYGRPLEPEDTDVREWLKLLAPVTVKWRMENGMQHSQSHFDRWVVRGSIWELRAAAGPTRPGRLFGASLAALALHVAVSCQKCAR